MSSDTLIRKILVLAANPRNTSLLRLDEEVREIDEGLRRANKREQFKLEQKWAVRSRDFYRAILDYQPTIVHFCGHAAGEDGIILENETKQAAYIQADALASMFKLFARNGVECVVLNACYSEVQAEAISEHINYVIGMNWAIGDKAAINFAVAFYDALAAGQDIEFAFELGCSQINRNEQQTPILKKKPNLTNHESSTQERILGGIDARDLDAGSNIAILNGSVPLQEQLEYFQNQLNISSARLNDYHRLKIKSYWDIWRKLQLLRFAGDNLWGKLNDDNILIFSKQLRKTREKVEESAIFFDEEDYINLKNIFEIFGNFRLGKVYLREIRSSQDLHFVFIKLALRQIEINREYKNKYESLLDKIRITFRERLCK